MLRYYCCTCTTKRSNSNIRQGRLFEIVAQKYFKTTNQLEQEKIKNLRRFFTSYDSSISPPQLSSTLVCLQQQQQPPPLLSWCSTTVTKSYLNTAKHNNYYKNTKSTRFIHHDASSNLKDHDQKDGKEIAQQQEQQQEEEELSLVTRTILNTPLGTLKPLQIKNGIHAVQNWINLPPEQSDTYSITYNLHFAYLVLERLVTEHATQTYAIKRYTTTIHELNILLFDTLLSNSSSGSPMMLLKYAEQTLFRIVSWHFTNNKKDTKYKTFHTNSKNILPPPKPEDLPNLITHWLNSNKEDGILHACNLLLRSTTTGYMRTPSSSVPCTTLEEHGDTTKNNNDFWISPDLLIPLFHQVHHDMMVMTNNTTTTTTSSSSSDDKNASLQSTLQSLTERMEQLYSEYGWEGIQPIPPDIKKSTNKHATTSTEELLSSVENQKEAKRTSTTTMNDEKVEGNNRLSSFELETLQARFVDFLQDATVKDVEKVEEFVKRIIMAAGGSNNSSPQEEQQHTLLQYETYHGLVNYFIRLGDPKMASHWLQQMMDQKEVITPQHSRDLPLLDTFLQLLQLWSQSSNSIKEAPWRAQELFRQMEELENLGVFMLTTHAYNVLAETWANSTEVSAAQKISDIFLRMVESGTKDPKKLPNLTTFDIMSRTGPPKGGGGSSSSAVVNKVTEATCLLLDHHQQQNKNNVQDDDNIQSLLLKVIQYLSQAGTRGPSIDKLILYAINKHVPLNTNICESVIHAHVIERQPMSALDAILYFENMEKKDDSKILSFDCYKDAMFSLVANGKKGSFDKEKRFMSHIVDRAIKKDLSGPPTPSSDFTNFLEKVLFKMMSQRRSFDADKMLKLLEDKLLPQVDGNSHVLSVACFNAIIRSYTQANNLDRTEETFGRLLNHYRAGHSHLMPNTASFSMYLSLLSKRKDIKDAAMKAEQILNEMIELHQSSSRDECKPDEGIFNSVLISWNQHGGKISVTHSLAILDQMEELGIPPDTFSFNTVMRTIVRNDRNNAYRKVMELKDRMTSLGLEPNLNTLGIILNACAAANSSDYQSALTTTLYVFGKIRDHGANIVTYTTLIKAFRNLLRSSSSERRDKVVGSAFKMCCVDGFFSVDLEKQFRQLLSDEAWAELYTKPVSRYGSVPIEWRRNLKKN